MNPDPASLLHDEIDRHCRAGDFAGALARADRLLRDNPLDRTARLYELLIKVVLHGPAAHENEVENLRNHADLGELERRIVRKILMVCYDAAERQQDHGRMWGYQRLLRRLVLNQTLDLSMPRDEPAGSIKMPDDPPTRNRPNFKAAPIGLLISAASDRLQKIFGNRVDPRMGARPGPFILALTLVAAAAAFLTVGTEPRQRAPAPPPPSTAPLHADVAVGELSAKIDNVDIDTANAAKLREFVQGKQPELKDLYQARVGDVNGLTGDLTVEVWIDGNGKISKIYESGATLIDFGFKKLIVEEIQKWRFPALHQGTVAMTLVLNFTAGTADPGQIAPIAR